LIVSLVVVDSLHFVFARALIPYLHPAVSAMYLMAVGCLVVGLFAVSRKRLSLRVVGQHTWFYLAIGGLVGASTVLTFAAMEYIDPGTSSMLAKLSVVISIGLGVLWLGERLSMRQAAGAVLSMVGVLIISFQPGEYLRLGSLMVIAGAVAYALHAAVVKRYGDGIDFLDFFFMRLLATTIILALYVAVSPQAQETLLPDKNVWLLLITAGVVDVAISRGLYYVALRRLPMSIHAIILTLSPAATIFWSLLLFGSYPLPAQFFGGLLVMVGVLAAMIGPRREVRMR
jgi:drug/metabolite transporter (DMT)-like permease